MNFKRIARICALLAGFTIAQAGLAQVSPELIRMDCGPGAALRDISRFSDVHAHDGKQIQLTASCYLIRHGADLMIWDTGYPAAPPAGSQGEVLPVGRSVVEQLAQIGVAPGQIRFVGVSHYHGDHTGQAASFPQATLLIGKGDWDALTATPPAPMANPAPLAHWISGGGKLESVSGDKDIFGDGSVVMLDTPGHTPGHHSLLVRLKNRPPVLLTGDLAHFRENYDTNGVPSFNTNRADTLASLDRVKQMAANLGAVVVIQHDPRDIEKLPAFPAAAK